MAYTPIANDILQVQFIVTNAEQVASPRINVVITSTTGATPPTQTQIASFYASGWSAFLLPNMASDSSFRGVIVKKIFPLPQPTYEFSTTGQGSGTFSGGVTNSRQTSLVVKLQTSLAGRSKRGRFYIPFPVTQANAVGGIPAASYITAINSVLPLLFTQQTITVTGGTAVSVPIIFHRKTNTYDVITASVAEQKWGTIRRRGSFGRPNISPF